MPHASGQVQERTAKDERTLQQVETLAGSTAEQSSLYCTGQLRATVAEASWDAKRQLVEALVEWVRVDTLEEEGKKTARITVRYRFDRGLTDCSTSRLPRARVYENGLWIEHVIYLRESAHPEIPRARRSKGPG